VIWKFLKARAASWAVKKAQKMAVSQFLGRQNRHKPNCFKNKSGPTPVWWYKNGNMPRRNARKIKDFFSFPLRAFTLFHNDRWGFSSLASERFDYVAAEVMGYCLDVGCGFNNRFVKEYLRGNGRGIDVFPYEGLTAENIVPNLSHFPFASETFESVTFIANINHAPESQRDAELLEAWRVLKPGGNIILTMGLPIVEVIIHRVVWFYDHLLGFRVDMDSERGMGGEEAYFLTDSEIRERLIRTGFKRVIRKHFLTQWGLNSLYVGWKK
jgi:SAM-dependent methyltransferase